MTQPDLGSDGSLLQATYIGYKPPRPENIDDLNLLLDTAASSVPTVVTRRKIVIDGTASRDPIEHLRTVRRVEVPQGIDACSVISCWDAVPDSSARPVDIWLLAVQLAASPNQFSHVLPAGLDHLRISTVAFSVRGLRLEGAPELALTRWLFARAVRAIDPQAVIVGGPPRWNDWYWPTDDVVALQNETERAREVAATGQWAADPTGRFQLRYYDGAGWTEHVSTDGVAGIDPLPIR